jgi:hypothetical protein
MSLGRVIAEPAAQGTGGRQTPRDGDGEPALGADKRTVGEHLGAVAHEPPVLAKRGGGGVSRIDAGLARIAGVWRDETHAASVGAALRRA